MGDFLIQKRQVYVKRELDELRFVVDRLSDCFGKA
jgi:hypothetical protein